MSTLQFVTLLFLAILVFWAVGAINRLQRLRHAISEAQPPLLLLLHRRHEWVSRMVDALRTELPNEAAALDRAQAAGTQVAAALALLQSKPQAAGPVNSLGLAEHVLDDIVGALLIRHESDEAAQVWVQEWLAAQTPLAAARQRLNDAVRQYNEATHQFPANVIATLWGFKTAAGLDAPGGTPEPAPPAGIPS